MKKTFIAKKIFYAVNYVGFAVIFIQECCKTDITDSYRESTGIIAMKYSIFLLSSYAICFIITKILGTEENKKSKKGRKNRKR